MTSDLFKEYAKNPTIELRNQLVEENLYMVDILIRKYLGKGVDYDDLYQVGALALVSAVERFDPGKGFEFKSFATPTILGEIKKYFRDKQWSLKVPRRMKEISSKVQEVKDQLTTSLGRAPTLEEISEHTGFSHEQIMQAMESAKAYGTFSLDSANNSLGDDGEENLLEKYVGFEEIGYERIEINEIITSVLEKLNDTYRYIFKERFIFNKSQSEIAQVLGVSQMTVSRAEKAIVERFKKEMNR
ncbi:MAG: SigB/SigF/SigG family RNA polymerase sigma factor [Firmicutes bacterium]|nr:SigB/SigF/SigG family RNA polymerase sigma factor [Bacillota bacterium]MDD7601150.1 SigB/SigF/SigG family RNA polymerase sigma factor [Bacillota bacterium]MDY5857115.1 SigB/SigF/SigG family RNA polymerase sigma factor [Anaerovoracaceae bacterium]